MIVGVFKRELTTQKLATVACESCGEEQLYVTVYSKFFVLGLPVFPTEKAIEVHCKHCKKQNHINAKNRLTSRFFQMGLWRNTKTEAPVILFLVQITQQLVLETCSWQTVQVLPPEDLLKTCQRHPEVQLLVLRKLLVLLEHHEPLAF